MMNQMDVDKAELEIDELEDDDFEDEEDQSSEIYDTALKQNTARMLTTQELHCKQYTLMSPSPHKLIRDIIL